VILDLMLPGRDGMEILSTMRKRGLRTPVLVLTARDTVEDRVRGLDSGADDHLVVHSACVAGTESRGGCCGGSAAFCVQLLYLFNLLATQGAEFPASRPV
jgi:hypothetical protein